MTQRSASLRLDAAWVVRVVGVLAALLGASLALAWPQQGGAPGRLRTQTAPPANGPKQVDPAWHALVHATLIPEPGKKIDDATIVLRDGLIVSVAPGGAAPAGARVWDCTGLSVYAGLVEPFLEVDAPAPDATAPGAHWNTLVTPQRSALDGAGAPADARKRLRSMGYGAAMIAPRGGMFRGTSAVISLGETADPSRPGADVAAKDVFSVVALQTMGFGGGGYPGSLMGSIALMRQTLADAQWYAGAAKAAHDRSDKWPAPAAQDALAALGGPLAGVPLLFDVDDELDALRAAKIAREFSRGAALVGSGTEFRRLGAVAQTGLPIILPLPMRDKPKLDTEGDRDAASLDELMAWEQAPTNARRVTAAGINASLTTSKLPRDQDFFTNLRKSIAAGLSQEKALAMLTTAPADLLRQGHRLGRVAPGYAANLVVLKGEIFDKEREIRDVWVDGVRYEIKAAPELKPEGEWDAVFSLPGDAGNPGAPMSFTMTVGERAAITMERDATPQEIEKDKEAAKKDEKPAPAAPDEGGAAPAADVPPAAPEANEPAADAPGEAPQPEAAAEPEKPRRKKFTARGNSLFENRLNFVVDGDAFAGVGGDGAVTVTGVIEGTTIVGEGTLADGRRFSWRATLTKPAEDEDKEKAEGQTPEKNEGDAAATPEASDAEAAQEGAPKADEAGEPEKDTKKDEPKDPKDEFPELKDIPENLGLPFGSYALEQYPAQQTVWITNATIWTSGPAGIIENGTIVFADGKIKYVGGAAGAGTAPSHDPENNVLVIDAAGRHVTPGLIDCHSHTGINGGVNEGSQAVTAEVRIFDVINPDDIGWYRELAGGLTAVNQLHGSANPIGGQNSVVKLRWGVAQPDDMRVQGAIAGIKFALGENVKQSNWDQRTERYPHTRMGVETLIVDRFTAAREYDAEWNAWNALGEAEKRGAPAPRRDLELECLAEILRGERLVHCHSYRQDEIHMLCRVAERFGFKIGTFQHVLEGYKVAERIRDAAIGGSSFSDWWAYKFEVYDAIPHNGAIMHNVGVVVSFNSDSDELARRMNTEAAKAVKYGGVPPAEALKFVTLNPAKQLKIDHMTGSLEVGKDADVVLWSGSPLSTFTRCESTWVDGRLMFSIERDRALRERDSAERRRIMQKILAKPEKGARGEGGGGGGRGEGRPGRGGMPGGGPELIDRPATPPAGGTPPSDVFTARSGGRMALVPVGGDDAENEAARQHAYRRMLEDYYQFLVLNGLDPLRCYSGDCGTAPHDAFRQ